MPNQKMQVTHHQQNAKTQVRLSLETGSSDGFRKQAEGESVVATPNV